MNSITPSLRRNLFLRLLVLVNLTPGLVLWTSPVTANPSGATVMAGNVNFEGMGTNHLDINNLTNGGNGKAIINWQSFSIGQGEVTNINQGAGGFTLNRVITGNPTAIYGTLKAAQGGVAVINPNGVVVHEGGRVDVGGLLAISTLDIQNKEFLKGGALRFRGTTAAAVRNYGTITSSNGDVVLMGNFLENAGTVDAPKGVVAFGAGGDIVVDQAGGATISVLAGGSGGEEGIVNSGEINAAAAELKAHGNVYALAIQNTGVVRASGYQFRGGRLTLNAGSQGHIVNTGQLTARNADGSGGQIDITGGNVELGSRAAQPGDPAGMTPGRVDASGVDGAAGGTVTVVGNDVSLAAEAEITAAGGAGGSVAVSGNASTTLGGAIDVTGTADRGGNVTVEGRDVTLASTALVDASGEAGGGNIQIGGGFQGRDENIRNAETLTIDDGAVVRADAIGSGRGGNAILWSDVDTLFAGELSLHGVSGGGFAEISSRADLLFLGDVDLTASNGLAGTLLLDPTNVTISSAADSVNNFNNVTLSEMLDKGTNVIISTNFGGSTDAGNISVSNRVEWYQENATTTPGSLTLLAMGDIHFDQSVRSAGTGAINVVAGWDGFTGLTSPMGTGMQEAGPFNMAAVMATMNDGDASNDAAGLRNGSVYVNSASGTSFVEVGSRFGETTMAGHDLIMMGGAGDYYWAVVGFIDNGVEYGLGQTLLGTKNEWWGAAAGNVRNKDYVTDLGNTVIKSGAFKGAGYGATGDIGIQLSGRLDMRAADNRTGAFVQIGHGGTTARESIATSGTNYTTRDGIIMQGDGRQVFWSTWRTNYLGHEARIDADIRIEAGGDILISAARAFEPGAEDMVTPDSSSYSYAQVGHGGAINRISGHGDITVIAHGATKEGDGRGLAGAGIQLRGGNGSTAGAVIGHNSDYNDQRATILDAQRSGDITVIAETGAVRLLGFNLLPREGGAADRNTGRLLGVDEILPVGSPMDDQHHYTSVAIGHGGVSGSEMVANGKMQLPSGYGLKIVDANEDVISTTTGSLVSLPMGDNSMSGDIYVYAGGTVTVRDNMGYDADGNWVADPGPGVDPYFFDGPGILREVGIEMRAANISMGRMQIGHGNLNLRAVQSGVQGDVTVIAAKGGVMAIGGEERRTSDERYGGYRTYTQIGHGGVEQYSDYKGAITVLAGQEPGAAKSDIILRSGRDAYTWVQVGHGGFNSGTNPSLASGQILGDGESNIVVRASGDIELTSRVAAPSSTWLSSDARSYYVNEASTSTPTARDYGFETSYAEGTLADGTQSPLSNYTSHSLNRAWSYAQIGHGGRVYTNGVFSLNNTIEVDAQGGSVRMTSGDDHQKWALIGMGGEMGGGAPQVVGGDIIVKAMNDVYIDGTHPGSQRDERTSMFGAVYRNPDGTLRNVVMTSSIGRGQETFGMIGNGGYNFDGDHSGNITITAGGDLIGLGQMSGKVVEVRGWVAPTVEGPSAGAWPASGVRNPFIGTPHALDTLTEASMMERSFQLYHGNGGTSEAAHKGNIVPGSLVIPITGGSITDVDNGDGTGTLKFGGQNAGKIDYTTGLVTLNSTAITSGNLETARATGNRSVSYKYNHTTKGVVSIASERTLESDTAIRPNEANLAHGRIVPGTVEIKIGSDSYTDPGTTGVLVDSAGIQVGTIDYAYGMIRFSAPGGVSINPTGLPVTANYDYAEGYSAYSQIQIGHGGVSAAVGDLNTIGHTGDITINVGGDVRIHGPAGLDSYGQIGHGGVSAPGGAHSGDITINAGGIVEFLAGQTTYYPAQNRTQYAILGHGGYNADGSHAGNITVNSGSGSRSLTPGVVGGGPEAGFFLQAGTSTYAFAQVGHGGMSTQAGSVTQTGLAPGQAGRFSGDISIHTNGSIIALGGTVLNYQVDGAQWTGDGYNYVQIGHGGYDADVNTGTYIAGYGHTGTISLIAGQGDIQVLAGSLANGSPGADYGRVHWAQIGHGGYAAGGDHSGNIEVIAENGGVQVLGGSSEDNDAEKWSPARIGHAGDNAPGDAGKPGETIKVYALGGDIEVRSGQERSTGAQIGNGGLRGSGNRVGDIKLIASGDLIMDGTIPVSTLETHAKIGHGDSTDRVSGGSWQGNIEISLGDSLRMTEAHIGHLNTKFSVITSPVSGDTYIAVGRNNPYDSGTGGVYMDDRSHISSAGGGITGDELRIYMPSAAVNHIENGAWLNSGAYTRTPNPGSGRTDEQIALEHVFAETGATEADAQFLPEGTYPYQSFGLYNIYYGSESPFVPVVPPVPPVGPPPFNFGPYVFDETYDSFFRYEDVFLFDGYDTMLYSMSLADALESDLPVTPSGMGVMFIEEMLDSIFGPRTYGAIANGNTVQEDEKDEELIRRKNKAAGKVGKTAITYYIYEPGSNRYSSYRMFGVDRSNLSVTR